MRGGHPCLIVLAAVSTAVCPLSCQNVSSAETRTKLNGSAADFDSFRKQFHRKFEVESEEFNRRLLYFQNATKRHAHLSSFSTDPQSAKYGINRFSDLSQKEFRDLYLRASADRAPVFSGLKTEGLPARFDWRDKAVVAPVQSQEACGSCWAFSVVGATQSVHAIGGSQLERLSVQQVLDCSYQNAGCSGGSVSRTLKWLKQWSRGGDDGSAGGARPLGCCRGCCQLAGLPGWNHPAPLLQPMVKPRCPGCWIQHYWGCTILDCAELLGNLVGR
ncbi:cathepsin O isoform X2 [Plectropomus leopardus]|uniref:cathepsin O isoform X2 n=1 Tax=Plectropomus leopardus TaxID=160734 RepID=UPI001C4BDE17|nr:cathepsin O isoform X2 [Plectropomus leopardus]